MSLKLCPSFSELNFFIKGLNGGNYEIAFNVIYLAIDHIKHITKIESSSSEKYWFSGSTIRKLWAFDIRKEISNSFDFSVRRNKYVVGSQSNLKCIEVYADHQKDEKY